MNLWDAATFGRVERVKTLLKKKNLNVECMDLYRMTPLDYAVINGQLEIVKLLAEGGADVNRKTDGETPIYKAIAQGNRAMVKLLLELGATTQVSRDQSKFRARMFNDPEIVQMLEDKAKEEAEKKPKKKAKEEEPEEQTPKKKSKKEKEVKKKEETKDEK